VKITAANYCDSQATAALEAGGGEDTGSGFDNLPVTSLVLVRQNARHLFEPSRTTADATDAACETQAVAVAGATLAELVVVQDECAGCLPLAAMFRPHNPGGIASSPETGEYVPQNSTVLFLQ